MKCFIQFSVLEMADHKIYEGFQQSKKVGYTVEKNARCKTAEITQLVFEIFLKTDEF